MSKPIKTGALTAFSISLVAMTAYAVKPIEVCGTTAKPDKTYLDCYNHLANIYQLKTLEKFKKLQILKINPQRGKKALNDKGMKYLKPLSKSLKKLHLHHQNLTAEGIKHLEGFEQLEELSLYDTKVTDEVFKSLAKIPNLKDVDLGKTQIDGSGFKHLVGPQEAPRS